MTVAALFRNNVLQPERFKSMKRISPLFVSFFTDGVVFFFL
jgi:hypothetical protein